MLIAGVLLWCFAHFIPTLGIPLKTRIIQSSNENAFKGIMAMLILTGLALIIFGWRSSVPTLIYLPPYELRYISIGLMLVSVYLLVGAGKPTKINQLIRHPQLTGVAVWAFAHLLSNGELRSIVLFTGILLWAMLEIGLINRREGAWVKQKPEPDTKANSKEQKPEASQVIGTLIVFVLAARAHKFYTSIPLF